MKNDTAKTEIRKMRTFNIHLINGDFVEIHTSENLLENLLNAILEDNASWFSLGDYSKEFSLGDCSKDNDCKIIFHHVTGNFMAKPKSEVAIKVSQIVSIDEV